MYPLLHELAPHLLSSSSPASPFQGRQGFNLGLYPLNRSSPHFIHSEPWRSHCLHCKCCWHGGHTLGMPTQPQTRPMTFLLVNQKRKKKEKKKKKKKTQQNQTQNHAKKNHTTPVGARLPFKETFLPNYLKASSATWWRHPPWPAHPPTACLGGEGLHPTPPRCPHPDRQLRQEGGQGVLPTASIPPLFLSLVFRASCCVGRGEPPVQSRARCTERPPLSPSAQGGPSSRCLRPRFSHRMFYRIVHMV